LTPAARIAATIEVLEKTQSSNSPADEVVSAYFRGRRYIGSKDRRDISQRVYDIQRRGARLGWWTEASDSRATVIAHLALAEKTSGDGIKQLFSGEGYAPPRLTADEAALVGRLAGRDLDDPSMPAAVRLEVPDWLMDDLGEQFGENLEAELAALNRPAPLDVRVNLLKGDRAGALELLRDEGINAEPTPISPIGLRIGGRVNLHSSTAYRGGFVEPQDEASQIAALLCDTKADRLTIDYCAGAGGKTLALAASMKDGGPLVACDTDQTRLRRIKARARRAGVSNVTVKCITGGNGGGNGGGLDRYQGAAERVLVDAPCSGSGAWRRNPAAKWKLTPERLRQHVRAQSEILAAAAPLVAPGGRLIYATCSVLPPENERQIEAFLAAHPEFSPMPVSQLWGTALAGTYQGDGPYLRLSPAGQGTDGFFVAITARKGEP
jgi:16S rRNA (cytosine967-C5)-methyltransferase